MLSIIIIQSSIVYPPYFCNILFPRAPVKRKLNTVYVELSNNLATGLSDTRGDRGVSGVISGGLESG